MVVRAHFDDGSVKDVTHLAVFSSSDEAAGEVSAEGLVSFHGTAEVAILVRFLDQITSVRLTYVRRDPEFAFPERTEANYIDRLVFAKHRKLQLTPSQAASDAVFVRRVYLDTIGVLPTVAEVRAFLESNKSNRRAELIDRLLERNEFAYFWALKWADVMRGNREAISQRGDPLLAQMTLGNSPAAERRPGPTSLPAPSMSPAPVSSTVPRVPRRPS